MWPYIVGLIWGIGLTICVGLILLHLGFKRGVMKFKQTDEGVAYFHMYHGGLVWRGLKWKDYTHLRTKFGIAEKSTDFRTPHQFLKWLDDLGR